MDSMSTTPIRYTLDMKYEESGLTEIMFRPAQDSLHQEEPCCMEFVCKNRQEAEIACDQLAKLVNEPCSIPIFGVHDDFMLCMGKTTRFFTKEFQRSELPAACRDWCLSVVLSGALLIYIYGNFDPSLSEALGFLEPVCDKLERIHPRDESCLIIPAVGYAPDDVDPVGDETMRVSLWTKPL